MGNTPPPWGDWEKLRAIKYFRPLACNVIYMTSAAINGRPSLDSSSLLIRAIRDTCEEARLAAFIKNSWRPRKAFRREYRPRQTDNADRQYIESLAMIMAPPIGTPAREIALENPLQDEANPQANLKEHDNDLGPERTNYPVTTPDPNTSGKEINTSANGSTEIEPATSRIEEIVESHEQIEGHSLSVEDRRGRSHILYNLPNLNSLPRRSSSSMSYLSASQLKIRRMNVNFAATEDDEIQSKLRALEERIAKVPIQLFNRFQVLQRGPPKQGATRAGTKSS